MAYALHDRLDLAVAVGATGVIGLTIAMLLGVERARFAIDWLILALAGVVIVGSIAGAGLLAGPGGLRDVLHILYAGIVLAAIPAARVVGSRAGTGELRPAEARGRFARLHHGRLAAWLIGGSLATLAALLRLAATG